MWNNLFVLLIMPVLFISGCTITPENIDEIAEHIQDKYDSVNSYRADITSATSEGFSKKVLREIERPDKYKDLKYEFDEKEHNTFEICNGNVRWNYVSEDYTITKTLAYNCTKTVSDYFLVFDVVRSIFEYNYTITEEMLNGTEVYKIFLVPLDTDASGTIYTLWFDKENYQLVKSIIDFQDHIQTDEYNNLELNIDIPESEFEPDIPTGVEICESDPSILESLQTQLESIIGTEDNKAGLLSEEEFEQAEDIITQIHEANCQEYLPRTYEQYLGLSSHCGEEINTDRILEEGMYCPSGNGLMISADDVTLDCNGHRIVGSHQSNPDGTYWWSGVIINDFENVTIKNCIIRDFENGIYLNSSSNNYIVNNTLYLNLLSGILLEEASRNTVRNNTAHSNFIGYGIAVWENSQNNIVENNVLYSNEFGLEFAINSNNNTGIYILAYNNTVGFATHRSLNNKLYDSNTSYNNMAGLYIIEQSSFTEIRDTTSLSNTQNDLYISDSYNISLINVTYETIFDDTGQFGS